MQNIIVFLNGVRGEEVIKKLKKHGHSISVCIIPLKKNFDNLQKKLVNYGLNCLRFDNVNDNHTIKKLKIFKPELFIVAGFSTILKEKLINLPNKGTINLHAGKLPKYRGGSPLNWQIINGEKKVTISIIKVNKGIDTGEILKEQSISLDKSISINDLHKKVNKLFPELVIKTINKIKKNKKLIGRPQNQKKAIYWHQRNDDDGYLNFRDLSSIEIIRKIRALTKPYPGAWAYLEKKKIRIFKAEIPRFNLRGEQGRICFILGKGPYVICKDRAILIKEFQIENSLKLKLKNGQRLI